MADLQPDELERLLDIDEVAAYLHIPKNTLYKWRVKGEGPRAIRFGKHLRFRRRDVEAWLDAHYEDDAAASGAGEVPHAAAVGGANAHDCRTSATM